MIIRCPNCSTTYRVSGSVFDAPRPTFRCTRCKHVFVVQVHLQLTEEEAPAAAEQETQPAAEASGTGDPQDGIAPGGEEPPEDDTLQDDVPEEDIHPPAYEAVEDEPELLLETSGTDAGSVAEDPVDLDTDEGTERDDADDAAPSYRGFEIDPVNTDLPEPGAADADEPAARPDDEAPAGNRRQPDFEIDDSLPLPSARGPRAALRKPRNDGRGSIVPLASLAGLAVFAFVLATLIYQANPQPLDSIIRRIPWYGSAVFDSRHFKRTLVFESLVSGVRPVLNQNEVFVVSGKLTNHNDRSVHTVRIEARLFDAEGKQVGQQITFVGNAISAKIIQDMTLREITLLQSLKPQNNYRISPNGSANFTIVFPKPKTAVESFSCRVVSAEVAT